MATITKFSPANIEKAKDVLLGEGVLYKDLDETGEAVIGATRGGVKLEVEKEINPITYDGSLGDTKGLKRVLRELPKFVISFLTLNYQNLAYGVNVTVSDGTDQDGTYKEISFDTTFDSTDILDNIGYVGKKANGDSCKIKVLKAFNMDSISFEFKEKDEIVVEMTYTGFYTYGSTTPPWQMEEDVS